MCYKENIINNKLEYFPPTLNAIDRNIYILVVTLATKKTRPPSSSENILFHLYFPDLSEV